MVQDNLAESRFGHQGNHHDLHFRRLDCAVSVSSGQHVECVGRVDILNV
jgi:hypothetical protein